MRKLVVIFTLLLALLLLAGQFVIPKMASDIVCEKLQRSLSTDNVNVELSSLPSAMLLFGRIDELHAEAFDGKLGEIPCSKMVLSGRGLKADLSKLDVRDNSAIEAADYLSLTATVNEDELRRFLAAKFGNIEDLSVAIDDNKVTASGRLSLFGHKSDVVLEGAFHEEMGMLYFKTTGLNLANDLLGRTSIGGVVGDILVLDLSSLAFPAVIDKVEHHEGYVVITAVYKQ